ncbi:twin-arginine translocation signal domain-containing protein [Streptacidiphilus sp. 4-A2]|nr:twin-arginine translocation signal domain-containing protein [Streptacidiphilus sp. 4-A2]
MSSSFPSRFPSRLPSRLPSRRTVLRGAATAGAAAALPLSPLAPVFWAQPAQADTPGPEQIHLQFGERPSEQMTVSWATAATVSRPRVRIGTVDGGLGRTVRAETLTYVDGLNKVETYTHHSRVRSCARTPPMCTR